MFGPYCESISDPESFLQGGLRCGATFGKRNDRNLDHSCMAGVIGGCQCSSSVLGATVGHVLDNQCGRKQHPGPFSWKHPVLQGSALCSTVDSGPVRSRDRQGAPQRSEAE